MTTAGAALDARIGLLRPGLRATLARVWAVPDPAAVYPEYLHLTHQIIRATVPVMEAAAARSRELAERAADSVAAALVPYWARHIPEERGHDTWVCEDLAALGHDPGEPWRRIPPAPVAALAGAQYFWIHRLHPVCLLGYIAVLEGDPPHPRAAERLSARTGHPRAAFRTLARHAEEDPGHRDALRGLLDTLPLDARLRRAVSVSALNTVQLLVAAFGELADRFAPAQRDRSA
ncbi:iron-containing redox enzyme family protein [Streptomyces sp. NPDC021212]|uniref:iron-containing redox enzyme family protein n=1 Tax=Streptomyces sp. NPDC021212 TaxID=3365118 RepID=UPI00379127B7